MQENYVFELNKTKKAGIVNIVGGVLLLVVILAFFVYLKTKNFSKTNNSDGLYEGLGFAIAWVVLMFSSMFCVGCLALSALHKIIFGIILLRSYAKNKSGCLRSVDSRIFMVSVIVRVTTIFFLVGMVYLVSWVIIPFTTPQTAIVIGLIFAVLAVFELVGIFVEKKAKQEQLTAKQYEPTTVFFS